MNYIVVMTISGSGMLLFFYLQKYILEGHLAKRWQYFFLKVVMVHYMVPMPFIGELYRKMVRSVFPLPSVEYFHYYHNEKVLFQIGSSFRLNSGYWYRLFVIGIWCFVPFVILVIRLIRYREMCKVMKQYRDIEKETENMAILNRLKEVQYIKKEVTLCICDQENTAFTIGFRKPVIVCSLPEDAKEKEMLLEHELVHIKRRDVLWKMAGSFVKMLHWFNPLVYLLVKEFDRICEVSCDEEVIKGREEEECSQYAVMLVKRSVNQEQVSGWRMAMAEKKLSKNGKWILERAGMILDRKSGKNKWNSVMSVLLIGAMVMLNSLTALAYEEVKVITVDSEEKVKGEGVVDIEFIVDGGSGSWTETILFDEQFVDEEGNIYQIKDGQQSTYVICRHTYVLGMSQRHDKKSDGSCTMTYYESQRCRKCGNIVVGKESGVLSLIKCIH